MNNKIDEVKLIEILPPNLREDPDIIAASESIDAEHQKTVSKINKVLTVGDIDNAEEKVVDHLALSAHADYYELSLPIEKKRKIAKKAYILHYTKGTPFAVEQIVSDAFDNAIVEEWFEYDGDPYYFRIQVEDRITDQEVLRKLLKAINSAKNKRSWLESVNIKRENIANLYFASFMHTNQNVTLKQIPVQDVYDPVNNLYVAAVNRQSKELILKQIPLPEVIESSGALKVGVANRQSTYLKLYTEV
ncbi:MAG: hypothetical protein AWL62_1300 [Halanaerobium sp. T82-1]|jgi:phage tail P2-like protein|nr:MAG: hypothetical protein AWL62_1300 [Halanaerobium sp. T82-1]